MDAREVRCNHCQTVNSDMRKLCKNCKAPLPSRVASPTPPPMVTPRVAPQPGPPPRIEAALQPVAARPTAPQPQVPAAQPRPPLPEPPKRRVDDEPSSTAGREPRPLRRTPGADGAAAQPPLTATSAGRSAAPATPQTSDASPHQANLPSDAEPSRAIAVGTKKTSLQHSPWLQAVVLVFLMGFGCAIGVWLSTPG